VLPKKHLALATHPVVDATGSPEWETFFRLDVSLGVAQSHALPVQSSSHTLCNRDNLPILKNVQ
jgi:hypothetical protein